jgi:hypothetical protein
MPVSIRTLPVSVRPGVAIKRQDARPRAST